MSIILMAIVERKLSLAIGVLIVVFIGLNLALIFTNNFGRNDADVLTGATPLNNACFDTVGGIQCNDELFEVKQEEHLCAEGTEVVCTNSCQINQVLANDDRACPSYCKDYCIAADIVAKLI